MIYAILIVYLLEWCIYDFIPDQWSFLLGSKILTCALLATTLLIYTDKCNLFIRSIIAWFVVDAWCNFIEFVIWQWSNESLNSTWFAALVFMFWLLFIVKRQYPERIDLVNSQNVNILILKPRTSFDVVKGLIGLPASSVCVLSHDYVWCFRRNSGVFERVEYCKKWTETHLVIDTKIQCNDEVLRLLNELVEIKRFPCIKCVWTIRNVLNLLGGKYAIKSWFDYVPGLYFMRII